MKSFQFILLVTMTMLTACTGRTARTDAEGQRDSVAFKYARLIHIDRYDGYDVARIDNPWKAGATLHSYVLIDRNTDARRVPTDRFPSATVVRVPLQRSIIFTSVHAALAAQLKAEQQVAGVADLKYIKVPFVQEGVSSGRLVDCGEGMSPTIEKIIDIEADAILLSPFENSGGYGQLDEVDIPLIECAEYMEQSPLARAEWMRFYGLLYGCRQRADSLFAVVDSSYHALCQLAKTSSVTRSVLVDKQTGSVWYVPGGRSTIGRMLADAQCNYPFSADGHSGSLSLPFEAVLEKAGESDVWLLRYDSQQPLTLPQLLSEQPGYTQLRPATTGEVYGCNVTTSMFYEESPFRPDLLLQDFIQLLHPDLSGLPALRYYHRLAGPDSAQ